MRVKKKEESPGKPEEITEAVQIRVTGARLSAFAPNPDNPDWKFYSVNDSGIRDIKDDKFDITLHGDLLHIRSRTTGVTVVSHFDWCTVSRKEGNRE